MSILLKTFCKLPVAKLKHQLEIFKVLSIKLLNELGNKQSTVTTFKCRFCKQILSRKCKNK